MNLQPSYISNSEYRDIKRFCAKFLLFALLVFSVDKAFAYWATQAVLNDTAAFGSLSLLYRGEVNSQVVFFGSSKTHVNIDAVIVEENSGRSCYNLAIEGGALDMCKLLFEEFIQHNKKPDIVFMEADFYQLDVDMMHFRYDLLAPFCSISIHTSEYFNSSLLEKTTYAFFHCKDFSHGITTLGGSMLLYAKSVLHENIDLEMEPSYVSTLGESASFPPSPAEHFRRGTLLLAPRLPDEFKPEWQQYNGADKKISPERKKTYRQIVELAQSHGITLILFNPPFLGKLEEQHAQECDQFFSQLAEQNEYVHYWSFRDDAQFRSDIALWSDSVHMNWNGAEVLSKKIADKLKILRADKRE